MIKNYREIMLSAGCNIEDAVKELLEFKEKNVLVCANFNGKILYSDTVTVDSAYLDIIGKTKAEFNKEQQDWREQRKKEEQEHKDSIPELTELWIEKGKKILTEKYWDNWSQIVPFRLSDLYRGMELGSCLDIIKILNNGGTLDEAKTEIENQNHSGMSFSLVSLMIRDFCDRGQELYEYVK